MKERKLNIYIDGNACFYNYRSCEKCGYIIPIHHHLLYFNNKCPNPECKAEFIFKDYWFMKGHVLLGQKKYKDAILHFNNALSIDPSFQAVLNDLGVCFDNLEMLDEAINVFERLLVIDPSYKLAHYNIGAVNIKLKKYEKTAERINKLLELDPHYARAYYLKACFHSVQKNMDTAFKELRSALNFDNSLIEDAKTDPDLRNLRETKKFKQLLREFEK